MNPDDTTQNGGIGSLLALHRIYCGAELRADDLTGLRDDMRKTEAALRACGASDHLIEYARKAALRVERARKAMYDLELGLELECSRLVGRLAREGEDQ